MRLKQCHHPPPGRARRRERRFDLSWVMAVVIYHQHAILLAFDLESSLGSAKLGEHFRNVFELDAEVEPDRHSSQSVLNVVKAGHRKLDPAHLFAEGANHKLGTKICVQNYPQRRYVRLSRRAI